MNAEPSNQGQFHLYYRELAEHLPNSVVYIFDRDLRVVFAGGSLMAKSRWTAEALAGRQLADIIPASAFAQAEPRLRATIAAWKNIVLRSKFRG